MLLLDRGALDDLVTTSAVLSSTMTGSIAVLSSTMEDPATESSLLSCLPSEDLTVAAVATVVVAVAVAVALAAAAGESPFGTLEAVLFFFFLGLVNVVA